MDSINHNIGSDEIIFHNIVHNCLSNVYYAIPKIKKNYKLASIIR